MNAMADTEFFREPIDLPTEVVFLYFARLFAFVVAAAYVAMFASGSGVPGAVLVACIGAAVVAFGMAVNRMFASDRDLLVQTACNLEIRLAGFRRGRAAFSIPLDRCRRMTIPSPPERAAGSAASVFVILLPLFGTRLHVAIPCGLTAEARAHWTAAFPEAQPPLPPFRHPVLRACAKSFESLGLALPLLVVHCALFGFALMPERPLAPACVAMGAFCVYASVAQLLFLRAMRGIWGPGGVRAMTVVLLLHQAYCVFLGGMPGLIGWRDIETGADLRNSIVLLVWAVLWSVVLLVKLLRCSPRATSTPSPAEETHAESAENAEPKPHAESAEGAEGLEGRAPSRPEEGSGEAEPSPSVAPPPAP